MPDGAFVFGYAIDASWETPDEKPVTNPITDFPAEANCFEPWKIVAIEETVTENILTDTGGQTQVNIFVYDHQGEDSYLDPVVECPELFETLEFWGYEKDRTWFEKLKEEVSC